MTRISRTYHRWLGADYRSKIRIGDSKSELLEQGLIEVVDDKEEIEYRSTDGFTSNLRFENDRLRVIWFNSESSCFIDGVDVFDLNTVALSQFLDRKMPPLAHVISSVADMMVHDESDVFYVVCRGGYPAVVAIIGRG